MGALMSQASVVRLTKDVPVINRDGAQLVIQAARQAASQLDAPCSIAMVDPSGTLLAFESFDGVRAGSPDLAIGKARSAALLQRPTSEIEDATNQGRFCRDHASRGQLLIVSLCKQHNLPWVCHDACAGFNILSRYSSIVAVGAHSNQTRS